MPSQRLDWPHVSSFKQLLIMSVRTVRLASPPDQVTSRILQAAAFVGAQVNS